MTTEIWDFTLAVRVHDPEQLLAAALLHPDCGDGLAREDFFDADGKIDINKCLVMVLDPGSLAGCDVLDSGGSRLGGHVDDEEGI
jgi:hypothetical protein